MLFGLYTLGGPWNCVTRGSGSPTERGGELGKILPFVDPLNISGTTETRHLKFCVHTEGCGPKENCAKVGYTRSGRVT